MTANIEEARDGVDLTKSNKSAHLHHVSSIAVAGLYQGIFRKGKLNEACKGALSHRLCKSRTRCLDTLHIERICRSGHLTYRHQNAAGARSDYRTHQYLKKWVYTTP